VHSSRTKPEKAAKEMQEGIEVFVLDRSEYRGYSVRCNKRTCDECCCQRSQYDSET